MKFGAILQACRERAGLTQEQMAELINRSRSCISKLENDRKTLDAQTLIEWGKVTQANEVVVAFLYGMDGLGMIQNVMSLLGG
ncbi:helix-turn-helix transcriptional regulator [Aneurinibacillus aneurinilyticus]|uniref:helix-turn-helix domain-containing protein n=1 Tax=Aneurinibacillus aneurinilyticus TaxID=1391 RepID=UPI0023EFC2D3|nr:helix-turn-helix transcriptional regulator [Aneurinibacillus aneurinilyticus]MED0670562.1 helix-turn-helix transcriptional regulator [Aneurinibacillus aneurinilyticus]MED0670615.1 helix-turn-helix transcriptional regulator [Aneurinibacillus aneurinilyticus]MED0704894.1 helix-turn-helix transcriptional regulator [Aneurinibacillus aneurinilyticus]MED0707108.1 helix-turn-helix transcriptional regulator [Aneurinibacillus aneurinilyticus]MED0724064.1 helix-turn-helix transcriptional regulator [A